ncbi:MAG TPA: NAD(P)-binding domain-containing protein, partial [Nitrososphaeraceae archaeon]|nr:NAD(P)-binding domain-containing protein [Nitrososphaeraceae archaeon]
MKIGIVGGTGGMGEGFALRWCANHQIVIGSRDKNKATEVANNYMKIAQDFYKDKMNGNISGDNNFDLAR